MDTDNIAEKLQAQRNLTKTTGMLYEDQVTQLKCWGCLLFDPKKFQIHLDIEKYLIQYRVNEKEFDSHYKGTNIPHFVELYKGVRWLLGDEWQVEVFKGKTSLGFLTTEVIKEAKNGKATKRRGNRRRPRKTNKKRV